LSLETVSSCWHLQPVVKRSPQHICGSVRSACPSAMKRDPAQCALLAARRCSGPWSSSSLQPSPEMEQGSESSFSKHQTRHHPQLSLDSGGKQNPRRCFLSSHCILGVRRELGLSSAAHMGLQCRLSVQFLEGPTSPGDPKLYLPALCLSRTSQDICVVTGTHV